MPILDVPSKTASIDIVLFLTSISSEGNKFFLMMVDYAIICMHSDMMISRKHSLKSFTMYFTMNKLNWFEDL